MKKIKNFDKLRLLLVAITAIILISGCSGVKLEKKNYYLMDYVQIGERPEMVQDIPFPYTVVIDDARLSKTYTRKQIVKRHYSLLMQYMSNELWAVRLSDAIPDIVAQRIEYYNSFKNVWRNTPVTLPDYQIKIEVNSLEMYENQKDLVADAGLSMKFTLYKMNEGNNKIPDIYVEHSFNRKERIPPMRDNMTDFAQKINEMILEETSNFMAKALNEFKGLETVEVEHLNTKDDSYSEIDYSKDVLGEIEESDQRELGLLYMPNLSGSDNEPYYEVYDSNDIKVDEPRFGQEVSLEVGKYTVLYGEANETIKMTKDVEIFPYWRKSVQPDWGCLIVNVMDEQRNYIKVGYNIFKNFDDDAGTDYGIDYPADETLGEKPRVWILRPGSYKVTINNESFNTYRDFTTIEVKENECQRLTLVIEEDETTGLFSLIGAGEMNDDDDNITDSNWNINSAIHFNFNMTSDNETDKDNSEFSLNMSGQLDNVISYQQGRINYTMKNLIEVGTSKDEDYEEFRVDLDDFDLKNTLIYDVISSIGLYGRFDANTHLFPSYQYDLNYIQIDAEGDTIMADNVHRYKSSPSLLPITLKEGFGINYQFLNTAKADMNLRAGLGMRQDIRSNVFSLSNSYTVNGVSYNIYTEDESVYNEGIEASLVGDLQIMQNLTYSLTADVLFPFDDMQNYTMDMENIINLKLLKYVSIDYRLKFFSRESEGELDYIANKQSVFLRFTYNLR